MPKLLLNRNQTKCPEWCCASFKILSPFTGQTQAWCPKMSMTWIWQAGQRASWLKKGIPSHLFIEIDHWSEENLFWWIGRALIHALACGIAQAISRALSTTFDDSTRSSKHFESIRPDRVLWFVGFEEESRWSLSATSWLKVAKNCSTPRLAMGLERKVSTRGLDFKKEAI